MLEKLTTVQLVLELPACYEIRNLTNAVRTDRFINPLLTLLVTCTPHKTSLTSQQLIRWSRNSPQSVDFERLTKPRTPKYWKYAVFWGIMLRRVVIVYRRFGTTYRSHIQGSTSWTSWPLKMGPIRRPETSVKDYHSTLRNIPEERRSHQHRGGSLKSKPKYLSPY